MNDNSVGSTDLSPAEIATSAPNRFFGIPMQPPTLRVVPTEMTMNMHMFGAMYAPTHSVTMMAMANFVEKEMTHTTFMGPVGATVLGEFETKVSGVGDTRIAALIKLHKTNQSSLHLTAGVSLPTGGTDDIGQVLTPMNTAPVTRLPYPMQIGSGTYDLIAGVTYSGNNAMRLGWGGQLNGVFRMGDNDEGYSLGDEVRASFWLSYLLRENLSASLRVEGYDRGNIDGIDRQIVLPVQTADPDRQAAQRINLGVGVNWMFASGKNRLSVELVEPLHQNLDGPQLKTDTQIVLGFQSSL